MRYTILLSALACLSSQAFTQPIPDHVREVLDNRFNGWTLNRYSIPAGCIDSQWVRLNSNAKSFYSCRLNEDDRTDYAIRFVVGRGSSLFEYFVALVSNARTYDVFVLDSCATTRGAGHRYLTILRAGHETAFFGPDDPDAEINKYAQIGKNGQTIFPVDAVIIEPICESFYKAVSVDGYVYIHDHFYDFSAAD